MTHYEEITWRCIPLLVGYDGRSKDFEPTSITAMVDGEEATISDNLLHFLKDEAIAEIGEIVRNSGKDDS